MSCLSHSFAFPACGRIIKKSCRSHAFWYSPVLNPSVRTSLSNSGLSLLKIFVPPMMNDYERFLLCPPSHLSPVCPSSAFIRIHSPFSDPRHPLVSLGPSQLLREHGSRSADVWPKLWRFVNLLEISAIHRYSMIVIDSLGGFCYFYPLIFPPSFWDI